MELQKKLDDMIGKSFMYNAKVYKVLKYYQTIDGTVTIATDKELLSFDNRKIKDELKNFLPVADENSSTALTVLGRDKTALNELVTTLKENITLVKESKDNIPTAKAINDAVKSIIDVAKLEIEAIKITKNI